MKPADPRYATRIALIMRGAAARRRRADWPGGPEMTEAEAAALAGVPGAKVGQADIEHRTHQPRQGDEP